MLIHILYNTNKADIETIYPENHIMNITDNIALFIFRRDLRLIDNTALIHAVAAGYQVIPCFIFDPQQVGQKNSFRSTNSIQFMLQSLQELQTQIIQHNGHLLLLYGSSSDIVLQLLTQLPIQAVYSNKDYTPFSLQRDAALEILCKKLNRAFIQYDDALLNSPNAITNKSNNPYTVFTPFYKACNKISVEQPNYIKKYTFYSAQINTQHITTTTEQLNKIPSNNQLITGGRLAANTLLKNLSAQKNYITTHDIPAHPTTHLSAHLKFGTVSVREVYYAIAQELGKIHPLIRQLYWRDFYTHIAYHFPHVFGHPFNAKYNNLRWSSNKEHFIRWCTGTTGFPIVDAGMRELNATGFMHNRVRMIVASFLVKDLHINWQWGEKYFAQQLVDYDPAVNNGNWQWVASTGCDPQPYFRIFNPWLQQKKFDAQCKYIKRWVPELRAVDSKTIHSWYKAQQPLNSYPLPIVDHTKEAWLAKKLFSK